MHSDRYRSCNANFVRVAVTARDKFLVFLTRRDVEATNNDSERALRPSDRGCGARFCRRSPRDRACPASIRPPMTKSRL
jgi:hypothetical protein